MKRFLALFLITGFMMVATPTNHAHATNITIDVKKLVHEIRLTLQKVNEHIEERRQRKNQEKLEKALKDDAFTTRTLATIGSILTGNVVADLSNCLPRLGAGIDFQFPKLGGATTLSCAEPGKLGLRQDYFYSLGGLAGSAGNDTFSFNGGTGAGTQEQMIADISLQRKKQQNQLAADAIVIGGTLGSEITNGSLVEHEEGNRKENDQITDLYGQKNLAINENISRMQSWGRYRSAIRSAREQSVAIDGIEKAGPYLDEAGNQIDKKTFFAGLFKENPDFFKKHPDLFAHVPEIIIDQPELLTEYPDRMKKLAAYLKNKPKMQIELAQAWMAYPKLHNLYAELVPKPDQYKGQSFAHKKGEVKW